MTKQNGTRPDGGNGGSTANGTTVERVRELNRKLSGLEAELKRLYALLDDLRESGGIPDHISQRVAEVEQEAEAVVTEGRELIAGVE